MHETSFLKMQAFRDTYLRSAGSPRRVLDLGAAAHADQGSYRGLFPTPQFDYVGVDLADAPNVDIVLGDPHQWPEVETASVDVVISGQMLEHDTYFWLTMCEIGRVLRPGGWCCVIAPSRGPAHYFPRDCWRFYPDSGGPLLAYGGLDPVETYLEPGSFWRRAGNEWGDMMAIGRLPAMDADAHRAHLERLDLIAGSAPSQQPPSASELGGPAAAYYETIARAPVWGWRPYLLRKASAHLKMRLWNLASPSVRNAMLRAQGALRSGRASDHRPER